MSKGRERKLYSRIAEAMSHSSRYSFEGKARLARDCGLNNMTVADAIAGYHQTSYRVFHLVLLALERELGLRLDIRDLVSFDGVFESPICSVVGCRGCLPGEAILDDGTTHPAYRGIKAGQWMSFLRTDEQPNSSL